MPKKNPQSASPDEKQPPSTWDFDELNIEESKCRPGSKWTIKQEAADIVRELDAHNNKKAWSCGFGRDERDIEGRWMGVWKLSPEIRTKIMEALSNGRLREAMGYVAQGCYEWGLKDGPMINGARRVKKINWDAIGLALGSPDVRNMLRRDAYRFLKKGGSVYFPPHGKLSFAPVSHLLAVKLLADWENRQRQPSEHPRKEFRRAQRHRVIPSEGY